MSAVFTLDWLQYRAAAPDEARPGMDVGSSKAVIKHAVVAVCLLWLGLAGWRAGRRHGRTRHAAPSLIRDADPEAP
jgi:hypothetical protein